MTKQNIGRFLLGEKVDGDIFYIVENVANNRAFEARPPYRPGPDERIVLVSQIAPHRINGLLQRVFTGRKLEELPY